MTMNVDYADIARNRVSHDWGSSAVRSVYGWFSTTILGVKMANSGYILPDRRRPAVLDGTYPSRAFVMVSFYVPSTSNRYSPAIHHTIPSSPIDTFCLSPSLKERYGCTRHQLVMSFTLHKCSRVTEYQ